MPLTDELEHVFGLLWGERAQAEVIDDQQAPVRAGTKTAAPDPITTAAETASPDHDFLHVRLRPPANHPRIRELLDAWYLARARAVFAERLAACFPKLEHTAVPFPNLAMRPMSNRWGSTSPAGTITLNVKLIQMPRACIDYVVFHELCHLVEPNHGPAYYRLLDRVLPDWRERRGRLNAFEFA